jgi:NAD-dependent DNA ligase
MDTHSICVNFIKNKKDDEKIKFINIVKSYYYNNSLLDGSVELLKKWFHLEKEIQIENKDDVIFFLQNIKDTTYDYIVSLIDNLDEDIGIVPHHKKCKLEKFMGSLDKIKTEEDFMKWNLDKSNLVITEKLDGISALLTISKNDVKLCTRGNGEIGCDITHILKYMDIDTSINTIRKSFNEKLQKNNINIRGELIIPTNDMETNMRNIVSGIVHVKDITSDIIDKIRSVNFVAYRIYDFNINFSKQFELLNKVNMCIPQFVSLKTCNMNTLRDIQNSFVEKSKYQIDGIVISVDDIFGDDKIGYNPKHSIALKLIGKSLQTKVIDIEWNVSKHGLLKPRIQIEPICINGANINWVTGINARYIVQNNIGKNTILEIERSGDVIPNIKSVVTPTKYYLPENTETDGRPKWEWNKTAVDIKIIQEKDGETVNNTMMEIQKLVHFFKELETPNLGPKTIENIYNSGITNIPQFLSLTKTLLLEKCGYKDKSSENILNGIEFCKQQISTYLSNTNKKHILMYASGCFGFGIGNKKIKIILETFPNIETECNYNNQCEKTDLITKIKSVKGIQEQAELFIDGISKYNYFIKNITKYINIIQSNSFLIKKEDTINKTDSNVSSTVKITKQNITFTGFRDSKLKKLLEDNGNEVNDNVTKSTTLLVYKDDNSSSKCEKAKKMGIKIVEYDTFINTL